MKVCQDGDKGCPVCIFVKTYVLLVIVLRIFWIIYLQDLIQELRVGAFPTFHFYIAGRLVEEMKGADPAGLQGNVIKHLAAAGPSLFSGSGNTLGGSAPVWDGVGMPPALNAREARLKAFGSAPTPAKAADEVDDDELAMAIGTNCPHNPSNYYSTSESIRFLLSLFLCTLCE